MSWILKSKRVLTYFGCSRKASIRSVPNVGRDCSLRCLPPRLRDNTHRPAYAVPKIPNILTAPRILAGAMASQSGSRARFAHSSGGGAASQRPVQHEHEQHLHVQCHESDSLRELHGGGFITNRTYKLGTNIVLTLSLRWDPKGRLVKASRRDGTQSGVDWTGIYDGLDRLVR